MRSDITAVILAGGQSRRFGSNKALARLGESGLVIERIASVLKEVFEDILVLTKDRASLEFLERPWLYVLNDRFEDFHPLNGLASALAYAKTEKIFVCGCDMPFLNPALINFICSKSETADATVPLWQGEIQPLCGVYSKRCLTTINDLSLINDPNKGITYLLSKVKTKIIEEQEFPSHDQKELMFFDVDTQEEFQLACEILRTSFLEKVVIPAKAGIQAVNFPQKNVEDLDSRLRGNDELAKNLC